MIEITIIPYTQYKPYDKIITNDDMGGFSLG